MDGVMRFYMNDSSTTTDAERDATSSPAGLPCPPTSLVVVAADTSPCDRSPSSTATDSNANIVEVVTVVPSAAPCLETVVTAELNGNVEQEPWDVLKQTTSSPRSSEVLERLIDCQSGEREHVEARTSPAAEGYSDVEKTALSDSECCSPKSQLSHSRSHVKVSSVVTANENPESEQCVCNLPDSCSASLPALSRLSVSSQASALYANGQSAVPLDITPLSLVKSQSLTASVNMPTSTESPSSVVLKTEDSSAADAVVKEHAINKDDCDADDNSSSACPVPVVSLSCSSSLVDRLCSYVPSPGPLTQMYGAKDAAQVTSGAVLSPTLTSSTSSSMRNSLLAYSPLKVGGNVSEITAKISAARSCSRNGLIQHATVNENSCRRRAESFRSALRTADFRSTPWLAVGERSTENVRPPSLVLGLPHSSTVSGSLTDSCSLRLSSSVNSSPSMTPLASRSSSLLSNDSSTLRTSTLVPDNSRMFFSPFMLD